MGFYTVEMSYLSQLFILNKTYFLKLTLELLQLVQTSNQSDMIHHVTQLLSYLHNDCKVTLKFGDVIYHVTIHSAFRKFLFQKLFQFLLLIFQKLFI